MNAPRPLLSDVELGRGDGVAGTPWYLLDGTRAGPLAAIAKELRGEPRKPTGGRSTG
ncbi:MAG TPA: hypothetical protein VFS73_10660 [Solirubrobacterales bacterium]|nr:hypothetical protein [Solirubrobacterales bacterium]